MKNTLDISLKIQEFAPQLNGVFSLSDLKNIIFAKNKAALYRALTQITEAGMLKQFCRGFYVTDNFDIKVLSQRICPNSYISFGTVLSESLLIGSIPKYRVMAVKLGKSRIYSNKEYTVNQLGISKSLFKGFNNLNGVNIATAEKAFIDTLYFYKKGFKFSFDIYTDIDIDALDKTVLNKYLEDYKDARFVSFVKGVVNE
ncbi:MAG: hypothetical protein PF692_10080 [Kiritimatiellae bacterium]|jgi:hypothetical protein|nr:hypothetical protein [Kiritimatiellia bacterium]